MTFIFFLTLSIAEVTDHVFVKEADLLFCYRFITKLTKCDKFDKI
jgi:hypothetical protein